MVRYLNKTLTFELKLENSQMTAINFEIGAIEKNNVNSAVIGENKAIEVDQDNRIIYFLNNNNEKEYSIIFSEELFNKINTNFYIKDNYEVEIQDDKPFEFATQENEEVIDVL